MQGLEATFDDLSFEGGDSPQRALPKIVPFGAALAFAGAIGVWALHWQGSTLPDAVLALWPAPTATHAISKPFADIAIDANLAAQLKSGAPAVPSQQLASLETAARLPSAPFPLPSLEAFPPSSPVIPPAGSLPLPPGRDLPEISETESFPLPPARPPGFGAPTQSTSPERHASRPDVAVARPAAQPDNRNVIEKLFGWAHPSSPVVASTTTTRTAATQPVVAERDSAAASGGFGRGPLFSFPSPFGNSAPAPVSGYDHYTAVYDISARVVYLPDGTKLEAHSGLGQALDNPRFVAERAVGPTPPHVYDLTLREGSFHGVQAIRLNPVGEGGIYGRAGLLAHPFMLGPNGDSNGCVSFKDYDAFLRAYQNGQVKKLAVVAKL
ncbi:MAG TPA: tlde1 domain-containing protein [Roseiarcus sp.]